MSANRLHTESVKLFGVELSRRSLPAPSSPAVTASAGASAAGTDFMHRLSRAAEGFPYRGSPEMDSYDDSPHPSPPATVV